MTWAPYKAVVGWSGAEGESAERSKTNHWRLGWKSNRPTNRVINQSNFSSVIVMNARHANTHTRARTDKTLRIEHVQKRTYIHFVRDDVFVCVRVRVRVLFWALFNPANDERSFHAHTCTRLFACLLWREYANAVRCVFRSIPRFRWPWASQLNTNNVWCQY